MSIIVRPLPDELKRDLLEIKALLEKNKLVAALNLEERLCYVYKDGVSAFV